MSEFKNIKNPGTTGNFVEELQPTTEETFL